MATVEGGLIEQASAQARQDAEIARRQKEADQMSRQLFADCIETVTRHGARVRLSQGVNRWVLSACLTPLVLLLKRSTSDILDKTELIRRANPSNNSPQIRILTAAIPRTSTRVSIWIEGIGRGLVLNRYKHKGFGEVYLHDPLVYGTVNPQGRANIYDVTSFGDAVSSLGDYARADAVPWPKDVEKYSLMDDDALERELQGAKRWSGINTELGGLGTTASLVGMAFGFLSGYSEAVPIGTGLILGGGGTYLWMSTRLNRRIMVIQDEIASRS